MKDVLKQSWKDLRQKEIATLEALEFESLKKFVQNRVSGKDELLTGDRDGSREYPIIAIDPHLRRMTREDLRRACVDLLGEFVAGEWEDTESAHSLLLLCQALAPEAAGERLRFLAESPRYGELLPAVQYRIAQTLVELGVLMAPAFWTTLAARDWDRFGAISWNGLSLASLEGGIQFLKELPDSSELVEKISYSLPGFFKRLKADPDYSALATSLSALLSRLAPALRDVISDWASASSVSLPQATESTLVDQISIGEILTLCWKAARDFRAPVLQPAL